MTELVSAYFTQEAESRSISQNQATLDRCVNRLRLVLPAIGLRNPKIGREDNTWTFCDGPDWVMGFFSGQLWLAYQLTADPAFRNAAQARRPEFRLVLNNRKSRDHDLGFQFSLHSVADWLMTGDREAREMALAAANFLLGRFRPEGGYIQAWQPVGPHNRQQAAFAAGRMIVDTMQNLALLYWAYRETGIQDFYDVAQTHAQTTATHLIRPDNTSFHTFVFDPGTGEPLRGETHQGRSDDSCWSRGQAWLIHGFAQCYSATGDTSHLDVARGVAAKAEELIGDSSVPVWDFVLPAGEPRHVDSSAGAVMAAGLYHLAKLTSGEESDRWRSFADRLLNGLIAECDLTRTARAQGMLAKGAASVMANRCNAMLPYGDYYFMEALMRSLGHTRFFW